MGFLNMAVYFIKSARRISARKEFCVCVCVCVCVYAHLLSHVWFFEIPWTVARQAPLPVEFSRQEYWSGLLSSSPEDLPDPGIKPMSPSLAGRFFTTIYCLYILPIEKPTELSIHTQVSACKTGALWIRWMDCTCFNLLVILHYSYARRYH